MTDALLMIGVVTAVLFPTVFLIDGARRPDYRPTYHMVSELALGSRGWLQTTNFYVMGTGLLAFAAGVSRALDSVWSAVLLAVVGVGIIASGVFTTDPVRDYPPDVQGEATTEGRIHDAVGPLVFLAMFGACVAIALQLAGPWRLYSLVTAAVGLVLTIWTAVAFTRDAPLAGLAQRSMLLVYWIWIVAIGLHLTTVT